MLGSRLLGPACQSKNCSWYKLVCSTSRWKISVKNNINTDSGELSLLMCGASLFCTPFAGPSKGWTFVFLSWGSPLGGNPPPLVAACGLSCAEACCTSSFFFGYSSSSTSLTSTSDSESVSATRISLMASSSSFSFLVAIPNAYKLLSVTVPSNTYHENMGYINDESKTDLKPWCDSCTILQLCGGAQVVFSKYAGVCCKLLPHNPYRMLQFY